MEELLAEYVRDGVVESKHFGHLLVLDSEGKEVFALGDAKAMIYPRSAIKSFQASAMVRAGLDLEPRLLALVCASHSGSELHQNGAIEILKSAGLTVDALQCLIDRPIGEQEKKDWGDKEPTRLAMNCSGKHSGMLATCVANGWPTETYLDPMHPLQQAIKREFEALSGETINKISVDGCGAPLFLMSLRGMAKALHKLATSTDPFHRRVVDACLANPLMVAGVGRTDTVLMEQLPNLFLKGGAEGVQAAFMTDGKVVVFKVSDGSMRAHQVILQAALKNVGVALTVEVPKVLGGGKPIGEIRAAF